MDQKKKPDLRELLAKNKGRNSKEAPKTQPPEIPVPPPPTDLGQLAMPNLKKRRPDQGLEEGELVTWKENKQQKNNQGGGRSTSASAALGPPIRDGRCCHFI